MTSTIYTRYHDIPPSCVLAIDAKERQPGQECSCEDVRHEKDWVKLKPKLSYGEKLELSEKMSQGAAFGLCWMLERFIVEWSLKDTTTRLVNPVEDAKGEPLDISIATMYDLDEETADYLTELTDPPKKAAQESEAAGPKRRSAKRSPSS